MHTLKPLRWKQSERGSMLIELLISMSILVVGLGALMVLLVSSMYTDSRSRNDTTSTMVAEHVLEQISAQPANGTLLLQLVDCANTTWNIDTGGSVQGAGTGGSYGGNGANLTSTGTIDWTQNYTNIPGNYAMKYVSCGAGGKQTTYDVRWNVITITNYSRMVVVSARPVGSATVGGLRYVMPAQLRTIAGM
jgi:hypothetical protein